ncbi:hypothetical protein GCM10025790_18840 [Nesterenkonia rhizosphaerae]|uniref:Pilus assembly protein TadE n=2 Tax=Nesterenkonia rhizosphaerae TaxID=1348272 RepID=A0ABP9FY89_9MICC
MPMSSRDALLRPPLPRYSDAGEEGSAIIEFIALATLLLIPAVWFLVAVAQIQAASYAAVGASDQAAKMYVTTEGPTAVRAARSEAAVSRALQDFGIDPDQADITQHCPEGCDTAGAPVGFSVEIRVPLPLIPEFGGWEHRLVTVSATSAHVQDGI